MPSPTIYLTFAHSSSNPLPYLTDESKKSEEWLHAHKRIRRGIEVQNRIWDKTEDLENITNYSDRLIFFHFGGHSGAGKIQLLKERIKGQSIAEMLGREKHLAFVFINGCDSKSLLKEFLDHEVSVVIATSRQVNDKMAKDFAIHFYKALGKGKSIRQSFEVAKNLATSHDKVDPKKIDYRKTIDLSEDGDDSDFPWGLYTPYDGEEEARRLDWKISDAPKAIFQADDYRKALPLLISAIAIFVWPWYYLGMHWISAIITAILPFILFVFGYHLRLALTKPLGFLALFIWLFFSSIIVTDYPSHLNLPCLCTTVNECQTLSTNYLHSKKIVSILAFSFPLLKKLKIPGKLPYHMDTYPIINNKLSYDSLLSSPTILLHVSPGLRNKIKHDPYHIEILVDNILVDSATIDDSSYSYILGDKSHIDSSGWHKRYNRMPDWDIRKEKLMNPKRFRITECNSSIKSDYEVAIYKNSQLLDKKKVNFDQDEEKPFKHYFLKHTKIENH